VAPVDWTMVLPDTPCSDYAPQAQGAGYEQHPVAQRPCNPSVKGVYGRKAGTGKGFTYSAAMKKADVAWDDKTLDAFIADPQESIPGNVMPFPGVADAMQRAEIIEYLKTVK
jgi:cytochrome c